MRVTLCSFNREKAAQISADDRLLSVTVPHDMRQSRGAKIATGTPPSSLFMCPFPIEETLTFERHLISSSGHNRLLSSCIPPNVYGRHRSEEM